MKETIKKEGYLEERHHFFHLRDTAGQERDFHFHEFDKIVILLSGKVDYTVENSTYTLRPWDILLVKHHTIHKASIDKSVPYERIILYLDEKYYNSVFPNAEVTGCFDIADRKEQRLLSLSAEKREKISGLLNEYEQCSLGSARRDMVMRETLIIQLLILLEGETAEYAAEKAFRQNDKINDTMSFINENLGADLSAEFLASRVFLSKSHFMRLFSESAGMTVHSYILQRRLLNASREIREGTSAAEAARMNGFDDYSSFYRAFRKELGITPREIKNN